jgi:uncharacterized protein
MQRKFLRFSLLFLGVIIMAFSGSAIIKAMIGSGPLSLLFQGVATHFNIPFGTSVLILNIIFVSLLAMMNYKKIGLGTIIITFLIGPLNNLFLLLIPTPSNIIIAYVMLVVSCIINAFGVSLYIYPDVGLSPFEGVIIALHERYQIKIKYLKIIMDAIFILIGYLLGGIVGGGTIIALLLTGPAIDFFYALLIKHFGKLS